MTRPELHDAALVLHCESIDPTLEFFTTKLGFAVDSVFPADAPREVVVSGHGLRICLRRGPEAPATIRLRCPDPAALGAVDGALVAPNGARVELVGGRISDRPPRVSSTFSLTRADRANAWVSGRAGMEYRDLVPNRQEGYVIASHIRITAGGPVPDYVHYHRVSFQMIYCHRGWVRVVYEDQG
ncbi:MAG: cupin, partial [Myxococcota bacterium]